MNILFALVSCLAVVHGSVPKMIWTYWDSEDLPPVVAACISTWPTAMPGWDIHIVHKNTVRDYLIEGVDYPREVWNERHVQTQSDMFRFALVRKYGGLWLDGTTILKDNVVEKYMNASHDWFGYKDEIFAFASPQHGYTITVLHARMFEVLKHGENRVDFLADKYNIGKDKTYHFPQRILAYDVDHCTRGVCVDAWDNAYAVIKNIRRKTNIKYKDELFDILFSRTHELDAELLHQPLFKINFAPNINLNKALPNSWWNQMIGNDVP